jgi:putative tryptophan/tyrosine transport system substrate-binding protein
MFIATMAAMSGWQMTRRELIKLLISAVGSWPIAADAQQTSKMSRSAFCRGGRGGRTDASLATLDAFIPALRVFGYVEGQNIAFRRRFADGDTNKLSTFAQEVIDGRYKAEVCPSGRLAEVV